jgi:hypothetical protein
LMLLSIWPLLLLGGQISSFGSDLEDMDFSFCLWFYCLLKINIVFHYNIILSSLPLLQSFSFFIIRLRH